MWLCTQLEWLCQQSQYTGTLFTHASTQYGSSPNLRSSVPAGQARSRSWSHVYVVDRCSRMETTCITTPQHAQGRSAVALPTHRLCYRPTVFFCHIPLPALSFKPWKFQHNFHEFYFFFLLSVKLRFWNCVPGNGVSRGTSAYERTVTTSEKTQCVFIINTNRLVLFSVIIDVYCEKWGTPWRSWLTHCAGSIPDGVIGILHWHNPSGRTMAQGLPQPLT
jgi:hypothetical protein